jgi:uncharacterized repeat protein (TIGR03803 family)
MKIDTTIAIRRIPKPSIIRDYITLEGGLIIQRFGKFHLGGAPNGQSFADGGACSNCGTVFSISTGRQEKVRYFFGSTKNDGEDPRSPLVLVGKKLYGTTTLGGSTGAFGYGTIFSVSPAGVETVLYRFKNDADGDCGVQLLPNGNEWNALRHCL